MLGHTIEKCYKVHGYPPGFKPKGKFNEQSRGQQSSYKLVVDQTDLNVAHDENFCLNQALP